MSTDDLVAQLVAHLRVFRQWGIEGIEPAVLKPVAAPRPGPHTGDGPTEPRRPAVAGTADRRGQGADGRLYAQPVAPISLFSPQATGERRTLEMVREDLGECTRCRLHTGRHTIVFGVGSPKARLMFIGEAPGADEDAQGIPFVGRAGQLLTKIIESIQLTRDQVYIANVVKCRPPQNRNPEADEIAACEPYLLGQIAAIEPKVICALGVVAVRVLLKMDAPISKVRGKIFTYGGAKLVPTYHPAFLLRSPDKKRDVWEDMKLIRTLLEATEEKS